VRRGRSDAYKSTDFDVTSTHGHSSCTDGDRAGGSWSAYGDGTGDDRGNCDCSA
jgi:hypothetical protein